MGNYRCFECDHECRINTGSMFGAPTECVVESKTVEWCEVTDITPFKQPPNKEADVCASCWANDCCLSKKCDYKTHIEAKTKACLGRVGNK